MDRRRGPHIAKVNHAEKKTATPDGEQRAEEIGKGKRRVGGKGGKGKGGRRYDGGKLTVRGRVGGKTVRDARKRGMTAARSKPRRSGPKRCNQHFTPMSENALLSVSPKTSGAPWMSWGQRGAGT